MVQKATDKSKVVYAIIRHNFRNNAPIEVVEVVKGSARAESAVERYNRSLSGEEKASGWGHHAQSTPPPRLKPGMDPQLATKYMRSEWAARKARLTSNRGVF